EEPLPDRAVPIYVAGFLALPRGPFFVGLIAVQLLRDRSLVAERRRQAIAG
uniref:Capsid protein VP24 (Fragments) n=1 Tax=Human herpesvirus 1 TaxID=10298 RepID=Q7LZZ4_HHV1